MFFLLGVVYQGWLLVLFPPRDEYSRTLYPEPPLSVNGATSSKETNFDRHRTRILFLFFSFCPVCVARCLPPPCLLMGGERSSAEGVKTMLLDLRVAVVPASTHLSAPSYGGGPLSDPGLAFPCPIKGCQLTHLARMVTL